MKHSISLENKKVNQFNSDLFIERLSCEQRSAPRSRGDQEVPVCMKYQGN